MPAMNAPSASERPNFSVMNAAPSVTSSRFSMNNSCERRRATILNQRVMNFWPMNSSTVNATTILTAGSMSQNASSFEFPLPNAAMMISNGTTARSWNSNTPKMFRPCSDSSSSRSASIFETMAVDDIDNAPPSAMLASHDMSVQKWAIQPNSSASAIVPATWLAPRPNTIRRIDRSFDNENSSPI